MQCKAMMVDIFGQTLDEKWESELFLALILNSGFLRIVKDFSFFDENHISNLVYISHEYVREVLFFKDRKKEKDLKDTFFFSGSIKH